MPLKNNIKGLSKNYLCWVTKKSENEVSTYGWKLSIFLIFGHWKSSENKKKIHFVRNFSLKFTISLLSVAVHGEAIISASDTAE